MDMTTHHIEKISQHDTSIAVLQQQMLTLIDQQKKSAERAESRLDALDDRIQILSRNFDKFMNRGWGFSAAVMTMWILLTGGLSAAVTYIGLRI